jgi:hypothetical protein
MIDIFGNTPIRLDRLVCHSGGAIGSDTYFSEINKKYGGVTRAYSYKTKYHDSYDKVEISDEDYEEGVIEITNANKKLKRFGIHKYMSLLARNWAQVKYSDEVFAIGTIVEPGKKGLKGYYNKSDLQVVEGGTGYAVQMSINHNKPVYVFVQDKDKWFRWSYTSLKFIEVTKPLKISYENFAGIGTREIKPNGINAIEDLYKRTFNL